MAARRAHRPGDASGGVGHVDQGEPFQFPGRRPHRHHGGALVSLPLPAAVPELDRNAVRVTREGPQGISARALHGRKSLFVDENGVSGLQQGVERSRLSLFVVVIPYESVVTQEDGSEPVQISRNAVGGDVQRGRPRPCLPVIGGIGEKGLEFCDVTDTRLTRAPVQAGSVPLLQAAAPDRRAYRLVVAQAAVFVEERREGGNARRDRPDQGQRRAAITSADREYEDEQHGDPANRRFPGPLHKCAKRHHRSPRRFPPDASCY